MFMNALIKAISLLPEFNTLKIHSLSSYRILMLDFHECIMSSLIKHTSKITKVYLEKMYDIVDLKIDYTNTMDIESVLRFIVEKINHDCNVHLRLLCFHISAADDEIIQKLNRMINIEKLLLNYIIKRMIDNISIEWIRL
ncbi:unnamed protein product [Rotaria sordida]|uniref:Uncharacterized protein n=1 Tax=Rotaria sordida TaxID=392033 RepID=A0A815BTI3_9BILA|nr:unnamed protein product [Rotaria sordida]CAF1274016.1 unnamed protein product [Rotaria sordida]